MRVHKTLRVLVVGRLSDPLEKLWPHRHLCLASNGGRYDLSKAAKIARVYRGRMCESRKCSKSVSETQTRQNSEIVSQRHRGKLGTCRIRTASIDGRRMYSATGD